MQLAEQGYSPSGQYIVDHALELLLDHVQYGVKAMPCLVEAFTNNVELNKSIDQDTEPAKRTRELLVEFTFDALKKLGRLKLLFQLLTNACVDTVDYGVSYIRHERMCSLVMHAIKDPQNQDILFQTRTHEGRLEVNAASFDDAGSKWLPLDQLELEDIDLPAYLGKRAAGENPVRCMALFRQSDKCYRHASTLTWDAAAVIGTSAPIAPSISKLAGIALRHMLSR